MIRENLLQIILVGLGICILVFALLRNGYMAWFKSSEVKNNYESHITQRPKWLKYLSIQTSSSTYLWILRITTLIGTLILLIICGLTIWGISFMR